MPVDILIPVRNQYTLFRQLFEAICMNIPDGEIGKIVGMLVHMNAWRKHGLSKFWNGGRATLKGMKFKNLRLKYFKNGPPPYGMSYEKPGCGSRKLGENYIGYLELKIHSKEYDELLEKKYGDLPFDQMASLVDLDLFGPPFKQS